MPGGDELRGIAGPKRIGGKRAWRPFWMCPNCDLAIYPVRWAKRKDEQDSALKETLDVIALRCDWCESFWRMKHWDE